MDVSSIGAAGVASTGAVTSAQAGGEVAANAPKNTSPQSSEGHMNQSKNSDNKCHHPAMSRPNMSTQDFVSLSNESIEQDSNLENIKKILELILAMKLMESM